MILKCSNYSSGEDTQIGPGLLPRELASHRARAGVDPVQEKEGFESAVSFAGAAACLLVKVTVPSR